MTPHQLTYLVFGIVLITSIVIDLGVFSKKSGDVSIKKALYQSLFWIGLGLAFFVFVWFVDGEKIEKTQGEKLFLQNFLTF